MRALPEGLLPEVFRLPVGRIRAGYYSDAYFNLTKGLLEREDKHAHVVMQVFQKKHSVLGGIDEAICGAQAVLGRLGCARRPGALRRR